MPSITDYLPKVEAQRLENELAPGSGPAQTLGIIMEDGAGTATLEAAARFMVQLMGGEFDREPKVAGDCGDGGLSLTLALAPAHERGNVLGAVRPS